MFLVRKQKGENNTARIDFLSGEAEMGLKIHELLVGQSTASSLSPAA
jgi:hypothetical protein